MSWRNKMKAYLVTGYDIEDEDDRMAIVFAETSGKTKSIVTDIIDFWYIPYVDLRARRAHCMDKYYQEGKRYLDWNIQKDRVLLVEELGWYCNFDFDVYEYKDCLAKEFRNV